MARLRNVLRRHFSILWVVALVIASATQTALAERFPIADAPAIPATSDEAAVRDRLTFLEHEFDQNKFYSRAWWTTWISVFGASTVGHGILALTSGDCPKNNVRAHSLCDAQVDYIVGGITSGMGTGGMLIFPYPQRYAQRKLAKMPENTASERLAKLLQAEKYMYGAAEADVRGKNWLPHTLTVIVTTSSGGILWGLFEIPEKAIPRAIMGATVGETKVLTQSRASWRSWKKYTDTFGARTDEGVPVTFDGLELAPPKPMANFAPVVTPGYAGLALNF